MNDALSERGRALEEAFYHAKNKELLEKMREQQRSNDLHAQLAAVSGIDDQEVLDALVELKVTPESLAALSLIPLVQVAWADGEVQNRERQAILKAAAESGMPDGSAGYQLLQNWLEAPPATSLSQTWVNYAQSLLGMLDADGRKEMETQLLERARQVALSAGGFLGLGNKISQAEKTVLAELAKVISDA